MSVTNRHGIELHSFTAQLMQIFWTVIPNLALICADMKLAPENVSPNTPCSESVEHVQTKYCRADFVLKATIKEEIFRPNVPDWQIFQISIKSQIKISQEFMALDENVLREIFVSPKSTQSSKLKIGEKYILTGKIDFVNGKRVLTTNLCSDWLQPWSEISHRHKSALRKAKFDRGCACKISMISAELSGEEMVCAPTLRPDFPLGTFSKKSVDDLSLKNCFYVHGHCVQKSITPGKFRCQWSLNGELKTCLSGLR